MPHVCARAHGTMRVPLWLKWDIEYMAFLFGLIFGLLALGVGICVVYTTFGWDACEMADGDVDPSASDGGTPQNDAINISQDDAIKQLADMMEQRGFAKDKDMSELASASFKLGHQAAVMHESCTDSNCAVCSVRHDIQNKAFKRGLEKGAALADKLRGVPVAA